MKLGDWICPKCNDHQYAKNDTCRKCSAPRPPGGDWRCPNCDDLQFGRNEQCRRCGTIRPAETRETSEDDKRIPPWKAIENRNGAGDSEKDKQTQQESVEPPPPWLNNRKE